MKGERRRAQVEDRRGCERRASCPPGRQHSQAQGEYQQVCRHGDQPFSQRRDAAVLEQVDELPQIAFVGPVAIRRVKTAKAAAAQSAAAFGIQWEAILERRPATYTEKLGAEWLGRFEARAADRDAADLPERARTDPAIVWEEEGKKGVRGCPN